jgi:hypothetical protein
MTEPDRKRLADQIAHELFTHGSGQKTKRLVVETEERKINGTGWSEKAAAARIETVIAGFLTGAAIAHTAAAESASSRSAKKPATRKRNVVR